jgi:hypothetical protein
VNPEFFNSMSWMNFEIMPMRMPKILKKKQRNGMIKKIQNREFQEGQLVLLFNSRLKLFPGKLKSRWSGPFKVTKVFPYGAIEVKDPESERTFKVNGQRLKSYYGGEFERPTESIPLKVT